MVATGNKLGFKSWKYTSVSNYTVNDLGLFYYNLSL